MDTICIVTLEERTAKDDITSLVNITIDNRLPASLDSILDRNTQLLFDQDEDIIYQYRASLVDKITMVGILSCIRNSGWDWATSNAYSDSGAVIRTFYFEKTVDLSKVKPSAPAPSKRSARKIMHFGATPVSTRTPTSDLVSPVSESRHIIDQPPPPSGSDNVVFASPKTRRASTTIADVKTTNVFKHLAERRKLSQSSHHPLDLGSAATIVEEPEEHAISSASNPAFLSKSDDIAASVSALKKKLEEADPPAPPPKREGGGKVGGLASMFEGQLNFQRGPMPKRRSSLAVGFKPGEAAISTIDFESRATSLSSPPAPIESPQLAALTFSRPVTERKRRPTPTQKHSIHISQMRRPLVQSASFEEAQAAKEQKSPAPIPEEDESDMLKKLVQDEAKNIAKALSENPPSKGSAPTLANMARSNSPMPTRRKSIVENPLSPPSSSGEPPPGPPPPSAPPPPALTDPPPPRAPPPPALTNPPPPRAPPPPALKDPPPPPTPPPHMPPPACKDPTSSAPAAFPTHAIHKDPPLVPIPVQPPSVPPAPTVKPPVASSLTSDSLSSVDNPLEGRLSVKSVSSIDSEKSAKNAAYFRQMKDEEDKKRQEMLMGLSDEEREKLLADEESLKVHENDKVNHFAKLGKSFAVGTSKLFGGGRGGRGNKGGRGGAK